MDRLLTQQDLAKRWQVSVRAIEKWRAEGILQPAKGIPAIRFTPEYIAELEGVELAKTSPLQVKRLEREIEDLRRENEELKGIIAKVLAETSKVINL
ncbi:histidine kinase [Biomaibacter acetigenes]|uniref:Histidine kinase n=1 Tax=Biomaibacter acetigenes TaxID=2316383 RepID=A0A3G2R428_9FIRM|nr:histidine kinase [Biomaibacter acetigenes]AYO30220.1 histidine kinase [Biomaibacter acetigenes]